MKRTVAAMIAVVFACLCLITGVAEYGSVDPGWTPQRGASPDFLATLALQGEPWRGYQKAQGFVPEYRMEQTGAVEAIPAVVGKAVPSLAKSALPTIESSEAAAGDFFAGGYGVVGATVFIEVPSNTLYNGSQEMDWRGHWVYQFDGDLSMKDGVAFFVRQQEPGKELSDPVWGVTEPYIW